MNVGWSADRSTPATLDPASLLRSWQEVDPRPALIVDADRFILWTNDAATKFLAETDTITIRGTALVALDPKQDASLTRQLATSIAAPTPCLIKGEQTGHTLLLIQRLSDPAHRALYGLRVLGATGATYADLREIFGLTAAEDKVLQHLLAGRVADEISTFHQTSLDTIRAQIKAIYAKMNVSSREALFSKAGSFRLY